MIENGKKVKFDYVLTVNGEVIDSSEGKGPLEYVQGEGKIIPGLESQMEGLSAGDERTIIVAPEDAYGPIDPSAFQEVPKNLFPPDMELQQGMIIPLRDKEGRTIPVIIAEIKEEAVVLNFNHPLAGQELSFQITIITVE